MEILFDPEGELDPDAIYLQVVAPDIVKLPEDLRADILGQYGALTVAMPAAALLSAAKLARGEPRDIEDVAWWIKEQALGLGDIRTAIGLLPDGTQRENAQENIVFVELLAPTKRKPT